MWKSRLSKGTHNILKLHLLKKMLTELNGNHYSKYERDEKDDDDKNKLTYFM